MISQDCTHKFHQVLSKYHSLVAVTSFTALTLLVANSECQLVVVDPVGIRPENFAGLLHTLKSKGLSIIIWTEFSEPAIRYILQSSREVATEVLFRGTDDGDVDGLRAILQLGASSSARAIVLHLLTERLNLLPHKIRAACAILFSGIIIPDSLDAFADATSRHPRTLQRAFLRVGLGSPNCLLQVARIARTWEPLQTGTRSLEDVALGAHCTSVRTMTAYFAARVGLAPRQASRELTIESFTGRLVNSLLLT